MHWGLVEKCHAMPIRDFTCHYGRIQDLTALTLNTPKSALFADSAFLDWGQIFSEDGHYLVPCLL